MTRLRSLLIVGAFAFVFTPRESDALLCVAILGCSCDVQASDMNFGNVQPLLNVPVTADADVHISCTGVIDALPAVWARIGPGLHGAYADRKMRSPAGDTLSYNLYSPTNQILGDGVTYPMLLISGGLLSLGSWNATVPMHGIMAPAPTARPGTYTDTIVVRIDW